MTKDEAVNLIWNYMHMGHTLQKADLIFLLGSLDDRVAVHAAWLFLEGWAPYLAISGDGTQHKTEFLRNPYNGKTEADHFKEIVLAKGVPEEVLIVENEANNTQENFDNIASLLNNRSIPHKKVIVVQKPYMERRAYATGKVRWPETELILSSPPGTFNEYVDNTFNPDKVINLMIGDLERIEKYPKLGFQLEQEIPEIVHEAFEYLVSLGYNKHLLKN